MEQILLDSQIRQITTKGNLKKFRQQGLIPAIVYGSKEPSVPIWVNEKEFAKMLHKFKENILIKLNLNNNDTKTVIIKEIQRNVLSHKPIHIDFYEVSMKEEIEMDVPLEIVGEAPGVKTQGGILEHILREIHVKCLPTNIPKSIQVDVSNLNINENILVRDLPKPKNVEILTDENAIVLNIVSATKAEEPPPSVIEEIAPAEPEVISKGKKEIPPEEEQQTEKETKTEKPEKSEKPEKPGK